MSSNAIDTIISLVKNIGPNTTDWLICKINNIPITHAELVMVSKLFTRASNVAKKIRPDYRLVHGNIVQLDVAISILINLVKSKMTDDQLVSSASKIPIIPKDIWEAEKILAYAGDVADISLATKPLATKPLATKPLATKPLATIEAKQLEAKQLEANVQDMSVPKLNFYNMTKLTLPSKRYPFIEAIRDAQDGHAGYVKIEQAISEINTGRKVSCWSWYVFPSLREIRSTSTQQDFLIDGFAGACEILFANWFRVNLLDVLVAIERQLNAGIQLDVLLGKHDADKFRQMVYLFVLAVKYVKRSVYPGASSMQDIAPMLDCISNKINYHYHKETFDIAQRFINSYVHTAEPDVSVSAEIEPGAYVAPSARADTWACTACTFVNNVALPYCEICGTGSSL